MVGLHRQLCCERLGDIVSSRWVIRVVVDIGYGIDIGDDDSYVTLAKRVSGYFALGVEPFRWLVDIFPFRA